MASLLNCTFFRILAYCVYIVLHLAGFVIYYCIPLYCYQNALKNNFCTKLLCAAFSATITLLLQLIKALKNASKNNGKKSLIYVLKFEKNGRHPSMK